MRRLPLSERILTKMVIDPDTGCWEWTGPKNGTGYGRIIVKGRTTTAHRCSYEQLVGPIPEGLEIDHLCRNRSCINPEHLEPVTHQENQRRAAALITHCPAGHEYTPENTCFNSKGGRSCRTCGRESRRRYLANNREKVNASKRTAWQRKRSAPDAVDPATIAEALISLVGE